ncbi:MAG: Rne/Rng family ribonuclease [Pseudomonadota bacterium]
MKRILINAMQEEELRVALVDGQKLYDLDIEDRLHQQKKSNIYKAKITRVEPSLEAAFVNFGSERHGFLPLKDISKEYFKTNPGKMERGMKIRDLVKEGQEIIVQVEKEERGNKGAALSTFISLAGRYLVLMPNNPRAGGISRRIEDEDRRNLKAILDQMHIPKGMGIIIRTAGIGRSLEELQWDLDYLLQLWEAVSSASEEKAAPFLIYAESNTLIRAIRDYLRDDISEVLIDNPAAHKEAIEFVRTVMPQFESRIKLAESQSGISLFQRYQIESQIETAFGHEVHLPSGGSIVIDPTEALVSIDVNSARATKGTDIEETAYNTNLEAADEVARQLRLRDMGGLVVIDFIDMHSNQNQRKVEERLNKSLKIDRARVQVGRISKFGLLEMSRQRLRPSLKETTSAVCPRCKGQGTIRNVKSLALSILRLVKEEALKGNSAEIRAIVPIPIATFLLNEKRDELAAVEQSQNTRILIIADTLLETPNYSIERIKAADAKSKPTQVSYNIETSELPNRVQVFEDSRAENKMVAHQTPAVKNFNPKTPAPAPAPSAAKETTTKPGLFKRFMSSLGFGANEPEPTKKKQTKDQSSQNRNRNQKPSSSKKRRNGDKQHNNKNRNHKGQQNNNADKQSDQQKKDNSQHKKGNGAQKEQAQGNQERNQKKNNDKPSNRNNKNKNRNRNRNNKQQAKESTSDKDGQTNRKQANQSANKKPKLHQHSVVQPIMADEVSKMTVSHPDADSTPTIDNRKPARNRNADKQLSTDAAYQPATESIAKPNDKKSSDAADTPKQTEANTSQTETTADVTKGSSPAKKSAAKKAPAPKPVQPPEPAKLKVIARTLGRPNNDPRENPNKGIADIPVLSNIWTPADKAPLVIPSPTREQPPRAINDPRI